MASLEIVSKGDNIPKSKAEADLVVVVVLVVLVAVMVEGCDWVAYVKGV